MNNELNLCEILKEHIGKAFYSRAFGRCQLTDVLDDGIEVNVYNLEAADYNLYYTPDGKLAYDGEQDFFPSKDQRDWNKWDKENNHKAPKTWNGLVNNHKFKACEASIDRNSVEFAITPIEKSALALLKIHQLIEIGYGGNITNEEWNDLRCDKYTFTIRDGEIIVVLTNSNSHDHVAFHTEKQRDEFLKYPENVQLLKDYFMI